MSLPAGSEAMKSIAACFAASIADPIMLPEVSMSSTTSIGSEPRGVTVAATGSPSRVTSTSPSSIEPAPAGGVITTWTVGKSEVSTKSISNASPATP